MYNVKLPVKSDPMVAVTPVVAACQSRSRNGAHD